MQEEIIGDRQFGFQQNGSITECIFWICHILEEKGGWGLNTMGKCIQSKEANDSVRWEVSYNILIEFGIHMKW